MNISQITRRHLNVHIDGLPIHYKYASPAEFIHGSIRHSR